MHLDQFIHLCRHSEMIPSCDMLTVKPSDLQQSLHDKQEDGCHSSHPSSQLSSLAGCRGRRRRLHGMQVKECCKLFKTPIKSWFFHASLFTIFFLELQPDNRSGLIGGRKCVLYKVLESAPESAYLAINQGALACVYCCHCDQTKYLNTRIRPSHRGLRIKYNRSPNHHQ